jgi:hypothetical protein
MEPIKEEDVDIGGKRASSEYSQITQTPIFKRAIGHGSLDYKGESPLI